MRKPGLFVTPSEVDPTAPLPVSDSRDTSSIFGDTVSRVKSKMIGSETLSL